MEERFFNTDKTLFDVEHENKLRPQNLGEYIGQERIKSGLEVFIRAALGRGEQLDHILLYGPPGLGKTSLAHIIANEMGANIRTTSGPAIESPADLAAILTNLGKGDVLFIDEIHRLSRPCEEILYGAMEDFTLDMILGKGPSARTMTLRLEPFTLIGATTKAGRMSSPLRDRFGIINRLEMYSVDEIKKIMSRSSNILGIDIEPDALEAMSKRSRQTPRIANRLLKRVRDFASVVELDRVIQSGCGKVAKSNVIITLDAAKKAFEVLQIDELGLDWTDKAILEAIIDKFDGGPVGIETLSAATGEDIVTIEDIVEPYLLQLGYIAKTPRGRVATQNAYQHLGR
ncbi:MAG: Holliday junction branch migration DNA helicase RuvB [Firmicutes bacterium]|nr:Holliday junction branch migration DNA helicase RuvB [Bacillota bacterium]